LITHQGHLQSAKIFRCPSSWHVSPTANISYGFTALSRN
jgi:hypothetical protein